MSTEATIGLVEIEAAQLVDSNTHELNKNLNIQSGPGVKVVSQGGQSKNETFAVYCRDYQARQIEGLAQWDEIWWVDSSTSLNLVDDIVHRGWAVLGKVSIDKYPGLYSDVYLEGLEFLSPHENEIMTLDFVKGLFSQLPTGYEPTDKVYLLNDTFTSFDTTNTWHPRISEGMTGPSITAADGKLVLAGAASTNLVWGYNFTSSRLTFPDEIIIEMGMEWVSAVALPHHLNLHIMDGRPTTDEEIEYKDAVRVVLDVSTETGIKVSVAKRVRGVYSTLATTSLTSSQKTPRLRITLSGESGVTTTTVEIDKDGGTDYTTLIGPVATKVNFDNGRYIVINEENPSTTSATVKVPFIEVYQYAQRVFAQQVFLPPNSQALEDPDFYRRTKYGDLPGYTSPSGGIPFLTSPYDYQTGGPVMRSSMNDEDELRQVMHPEETLDPLKFEADNGIIRIVPTCSTIQIYYNDDNDTWAFLNEFSLGEGIALFKVKQISRDVTSVTINRTHWTMRRGDPLLMVQHPYTPLQYTLCPSYYHDGTTESSGAGTDISMLTQQYTLAGVGDYESPDPDYGMIIVQVDPTTITSTTIPATDYTGIGVYDSREILGSGNHYTELTEAFMNRGRPKMILGR